MPKCIHATCFRQTVDRQLTCDQHWQQLPPPIQREVQLAYEARAQGAKGAIERWDRAKRQAIEALAQLRVSTAAAR